MRLFFAIIIALNSAFIYPKISGAEFYFLEKNHDFPDAREGEELTYDFEFTNTGDQPLVISGYEVACSCTSLYYPKEPIPPGVKSKVTLQFDTNGKYGFQSRKIMIQSNAKKKVNLSFRVFVYRW